MARQTSLQVTTPELTVFLLLSFSGPQTLLTVFGHSIWLRNTDQIHDMTQLCHIPTVLTESHG